MNEKLRDIYERTDEGDDGDPEPRGSFQMNSERPHDPEVPTRGPRAVRGNPQAHATALKTGPETVDDFLRADDQEVAVWLN